VIFSSLLAPTETAINALLSADDAASELLSPLQGSVIQLFFVDIERAVFVRFDGGSIDLYANYEGECDLKLSGRTTQFIALSRNRSSNALIESGVSATGKTALLLDLSSAINALDLDLESLLAGITPPTVAHFIGKGLRTITKQVDRMQREATRLSGEYATYEAGFAVTQSSVDNFCAGVSELRREVDRLEAKIDLAGANK